MKIQIASDLHLERMTPRFPDYRAIEPTDADLLVIAGDIHHGAEAIDAFADWPAPVLYVHGNHEAYHAQYPQVVDDIRRSARASKDHVRHLENNAVVVGGVRFLGCCLWTDYALQQKELEALTPQAAMEQAGNILFDHRVIGMPDGGLFTPQHALQLHRQSRAWLEEQLARPFDGKTVVVTHHGVHPHSIHERFAGSPLNPGFISDLTPLLAQADLWIHGHVHDSFDYVAAGCRVVTNPRGYALNLKQAATLDDIEWENPAFDARLVIEL
ncbi:metallophosphoesterase [Herbaspirillum sp. RV1423]|uniref:metallophosphoesterase n=1 Tax=Herbaspirillum sp. RV1423 TaxID=1443993 RepID=UPI0004B55DC9|nr:metallophosphoesterase [Herbaspirillum sp. RV1423]